MPRRASVRTSANGDLLGMPTDPRLVDLDAEPRSFGEVHAPAALPDAFAQERRVDVLRAVELQRRDVEGGGQVQARGEPEVGLGQARERQREARRLGGLAQLART